MISVGTKSETKVYEELKLTKQFLLERDFVKSVALNFKTQNIVVTADFEKSLNLEEFSEKTRAMYEPEQFSGDRYDGV